MLEEPEPSFGTGLLRRMHTFECPHLPVASSAKVSATQSAMNVLTCGQVVEADVLGGALLGREDPQLALRAS